MAQNRSSAVMQQRHEPHDSLDFFPTPAWATRALTEWLARRHPLHLMSVWEPACGAGHMAIPLGEAFNDVLATDVHDYGWVRQARVQDFLLDWPGGPDVAPHWIITNPPFKLAEDFIRVASIRASVGWAMFVRLSFLESESRHLLFRDLPPAAVLVFSERVVLWKGRLMNPNIPILDVATGKMKKPSSATSYCWIVWQHDWIGATEMHSIGPCRTRLERPGDYPAVSLDTEPLTFSLED